MKSVCREKTQPAPAEAGVVVLPPPRVNLNNLQALRREMGRVYRDSRAGIVPAQDGARLIFMLGEIRKIFADEDLEQRITRLEGNL